MGLEHSATPWSPCYSSEGDWVIHSVDSFVIAQEMTEADANRIVACVNACADIPTEALTAMNWQLTPKVGAKPIDVAKLILKMGEYREALAKLVEQVYKCNFVDEFGHKLTTNVAFIDVEQALE